MELGEIEFTLSTNADRMVEGLQKALTWMDTLDKKRKDMEKNARNPSLLHLKEGETQNKEIKELKTFTEEIKRTEKYLAQFKEKKARAFQASKELNDLKNQTGQVENLQSVLKKYPDIFTSVSLTFEQATTAVKNKMNVLDSTLDVSKKRVDSAIVDIQREIGHMELSSSIGTNVQIDLSPWYNALHALLSIKSKLQSEGGAVRTGGGGSRKSKYQKEVDSLEHEMALERLSLQAQYERLLALQKKYKKLSLDDKRDLEERLFDIQEEIRLEAYQQDMDLLEHQKAMGEMTTQEEIEALNTIKKAHALTKEEIWAIDEKLFALKEQLMDEEKDLLNEKLDDEKDKVTGLYDTLVEALENKYEQERETHKKALSDKIEALQKEQDEEDEARQKKAYEDNLAELQRELRTEKSARKRREIEKEINALILSEKERLEDDLRQKEIDDLQDEMDRVDEEYDKLTEEENLKQEALKLALSGNINEMVSIIDKYQEKFKNAGENLMQYLTEGVTAEKEGLLNTLKSIFERIEQDAVANIEQIASQGVGVNRNSVQVDASGWVINEASDKDAIFSELESTIRRAQREG